MGIQGWAHMNSLWLPFLLDARLFDVVVPHLRPYLSFSFRILLHIPTFSYKMLDYDVPIRNQRFEHTFLWVGSTSRRKHCLRALLSGLVRVSKHIDTDVDALHRPPMHIGPNLYGPEKLLKTQGSVGRYFNIDCPNDMRCYRATLI